MPFKFMFTSGLLISTIMAISSNNWLFIWMSMELNMLSFIPIIITSSNKTQNIEATVKYFLAQSFGSALLLMTSMLLMFHMTPTILNMMLTSSILLKLGSAPFHFWYPSVMTSMSWMNCLVLSTWQKLAPLSIISFIISYSSTTMLTVVAATCSIIGGMYGMMQAHLRTILAYSSIGHIGWMLSMLTINMPMKTMIYYMFYIILISPIFIMMKIMQMSSYKIIPEMHLLSSSKTMTFWILMFSLGGLPPLTGFLPKLMVLTSIMTYKKLLVVALILGSVMNLYFYLSMSFVMMTTKTQTTNFMSTKTNHTQVIITSLMAVMGTISLTGLPILIL